MALGFANGIVGFACRDVYYQLCEFVGIAGTFGHEASMPQALPSSLMKSKLTHYRGLEGVAPRKCSATLAIGPMIMVGMPKRTAKNPR